jgi:hypothetical protein
LAPPHTARRLVEQLREFIRLCISREWLSENWASSRHGMKVDTSVEPKEPFSDEELQAICSRTEFVSDGHGFRTKRMGQQNARELLVFVWVLRYTSLRISDAVMLERNQLVSFLHCSYTHRPAYSVPFDGWVRELDGLLSQFCKPGRDGEREAILAIRKDYPQISSATIWARMFYLGLNEIQTAALLAPRVVAGGSPTAAVRLWRRKNRRQPHD